MNEGTLVIETTHEKLVAAFEAWRIDALLNPETFLDETDDGYGEDCADYFERLLGLV